MSRGNGTKEKRENTFMHTHAFMYISVYMHSGKGVPTLPPTLNEKDRGVKKTVNAAEQPTHTGSRAAADWLGCSHNKQLIGSLGLCKKRKKIKPRESPGNSRSKTQPPHWGDQDRAKTPAVQTRHFTALCLALPLSLQKHADKKSSLASVQQTLHQPDISMQHHNNNRRRVCLIRVILAACKTRFSFNKSTEF